MLNISINRLSQEINLSSDVKLNKDWSSSFIEKYTKYIFSFVDFVLSLDEKQVKDYRAFCISSIFVDDKKEQYFTQFTVSKIDEAFIALAAELKDYSFLKLEDCPLKIIHIPSNNVIEIDEDDKSRIFGLKENELIVLHKVMDGLESSEIAETLGVSTETIKKYRKEILRKSNSKTFFEVISKYYKNINKVI